MSDSEVVASMLSGALVGTALAAIATSVAATKPGFSLEEALSPKGTMVCTESDLEALRGPLGRGYTVSEYHPAPDQRCAVVRIAPAPVEAP